MQGAVEPAPAELVAVERAEQPAPEQVAGLAIPPDRRSSLLAQPPTLERHPSRLRQLRESAGMLRPQYQHRPS